METKNNGPRIIISGGGTGGHIFPAVSIANAIKELRPDAEILFVGAEGRMEMQRVPDAGYKIIGLPVAGFDRKRLWKNFAVIIKLLRSGHDGSPYFDTRAEFLCRSDKQVACTESM